MTEERDPVVGEALDRVVVPAATDDFWSGFEARLADAEAPVRAGDGPVRIVADEGAAPDETDGLTVVPLARRRSASPSSGRRRLYAVAAVAAAVVVAVAIAWRPSDDPGTQVASEPESGAELSVPAETKLAGPDATTPEGSVTLWLTALANGDFAGAEALTGPHTVAYELANTGRTPVEFLSSYEESQFNRLEGDGAATVRAVAVGEFQGQAAQVVVLTQPLEGMDLPSASYPVVRTEEGKWLVEPAAFSAESGGRLEIITPEPGEYGLTPIVAGQPIEIVADGDGTYVVAVDDRPAMRIRASDAAGGRITASVTDGLEPGDHLLVIARVDDDVFTAGAFHLTIT